MTTQQVAIITGSSKGIGNAIARALANQNIAVVVTSRNKVHAEETAAEISREGAIALGVEFDIENKSHLDRLIETTLEHFGRLDILVNNAVSQSCLLPSSDFEDHQVITTITTNLSHTYLLCQKAYPFLKQSQGNILNIASVVANRHLLGLPLYGLIKGAILQMTTVLAAEWAKDQVRVNAINPGFVRTQAFVDLGFEQSEINRAYEFYKDYQPLSGVGCTEDIANAALYLTSAASKTVTGTLLDVDGAYSVKALDLYKG